jgi:hypothetical protein
MTQLPLPQPLQLLAAALKEDGGRSLGRAVLFAVGIDLGVFHASIPEIAIASGVSESRLNEVEAEARRALDEAAPKVANQHVVSQALMRQFCEITPDGKRLLMHSIANGRSSLRATKRIGNLTDFVKIDSQFTEDLWGKTENHLPSAISAARSGTLFASARYMETIKDAIALHFARSFELQQAHELIWTVGMKRTREIYMSNPSGLESLFFKKYGLFPPSAKAAREIVSADLIALTQHLFDRGIVFRLRVVDMFETARQFLTSVGLQVASPPPGTEFLLGDVPAIPIDETRRALGVMGGVPFANATTVILPLAPDLLVALGRKDEYVTLPATFVTQLNKFQIMKAHHQVFMRPGAGLDALVLAERPPTP